MSPVYVTLKPGRNGSGMFGKPTPDCGSGGTSVPSRSVGTRLSGGFVFVVDQSSSATHSARWIGAELSGFWNCWQAPLEVPLPVPCWWLEMK